MTIREVARLFGRSKSTIYRWLRHGLLGRFEERGLVVAKVGRRWIIDRVEDDVMDVSKWPVSNVTLAFPLGMPSDVALLGLCDMPADVPVGNRYDDAGNKLPDPVGICLSMVRFQIFDAANDVKLAEEAALPHDGRVCCVFGGKDLNALWDVLAKPGAERMVYIEAYPRFYRLDEDGHAHLEGDDRGYHAGAKDRSSVYVLGKNEHAELTIDGVAAPKPTDPGPTPEEQAAIDASDRQMREEREAHERQEREARERVARENAEHNARMDREREAQEAEQRRQSEEAAAQAAREREENDRLDREATAERERLGIKEPGKVSEADVDPYMESIRNYYETQIKGDTNEAEMLKAFLERARARGREMARAADAFEREMAGQG